VCGQNVELLKAKLKYVVWNAVAQLVEALRYKPKVEGSSLEFFTDNPSGRTVAVVWTQFVTAMSISS